MLLAIALLFDLVSTRFPLRGHPVRAATAGLAVGVLGVGIMATPFVLQSGLVFDARSVLLAVSGLFFGAGATLVAMAVTAAYRLYLGGGGAVTGVLVIIASGVIGLAWRARREDRLETVSIGELYRLGLVVHVVMLGLMFTLPAELAVAALSAIALPVIVVFPLATTALGMLLVHRLRRESLGARLEASEARYRSLFENNHAVMLVTDPRDGSIVDANPAAVRFYGWSRQELTARALADLTVAPADGAGAGSTTNPGESRHRLASGEVRHVTDTSGVLVLDGRTLHYSIIQDVTAEREAVEALRVKSAALDAAANAILITDLDGVIEWVNAAFCRLYGHSCEEVTGRKAQELVAPGFHPADFFSDIRKSLVAGACWTGRIMSGRSDGSRFEAEMAVTPIVDAHGQVTRVITVLQDLTDWRAMEERLALSEKLESVGQLAGGVAHDFNNLLTVINGTLDMVLDDLPARQQARDDLEEVRRAGERASVLTRQLLAFSGRQVLRREALNLNDLITEMNRILRRLIDENIRIVTDFDPAVVPVHADRGQLEQIVVNLVVNARDAMPAGGTLTLATSAVERDGTPHVRLRVTDTGGGIDPEIQGRIFDPFFTTKAAGKGTGLGLATVYGIVTQNGGDIHLESTLGGGTTFNITLPGSAQPHTAPHPDGRGGVVAGSETILLVEDEAAIRSLAERVLRRSGYTVLTAADGPEALNLLRRHGSDISLLFTDIVMPGMSGTELLARALRLQPDLRVLFASGYAAETLSHHGLAGDANHFLEKPYSVHGLTAKIRSVLDASDPSPSA
jgi:two-component system, cell cycle sensor histidine kinase and response regulator CckA